MIRIPVEGVRSLSFVGNTLFDYASGRAFLREGGVTRFAEPHDDAFDTAIVDPRGRFAVVYERLGVRGRVVDGQSGHVLRDLTRDAYYADTFEYPVALWTSVHEHAGLAFGDGSSGHTLLAHCPEVYGVIEIEDLDAGRRLTHPPREPQDFFHSGLAVSPSGRHLVSAGWVWQPWDVALCFDLEVLLRRRSVGGGEVWDATTTHEGASAAWGPRDRLFAGSMDEPDERFDTGWGLTVLDIDRSETIQTVALPHHPGRMLPLDDDHVVTFYEFPRLYRLSDATVVQSWPFLACGERRSSITRHLQPPPPLALDARGRRFAVAVDGGVVVVEL